MTETTDIKVLRDSAECMANLLDNLAGYEPSDIDMDAVELRFEGESGCDTGCDISIVGTAQKSADIIRALLDQLEAERQQREAAEKERDRLLNQEFQQRLANAEHQLEMKDLAIRNVKASRMAQFKKRKTAEAELAELRGAQEPVVVLPPRKSSKDYVDDEFTNADLAAIYNAARLELKKRIQNAGIVVKDGE